MTYQKTSERREKRLLREQMRSLGLGYRDIRDELARRYRLRPRAAWREAYGWSLQDTANRINAFRGQVGLDPGGLAGMTQSHLSEYENWPGHGPKPTGRRPTPYLLAVLASIYDCPVTDLLDLADREHMPPADLLILDKYTQHRAAHETETGPQPDLAAGRPDGDHVLASVPLNGDAARGGFAVRPGDLAPFPGGTTLVPGDVAYRLWQVPVSGSSWMEREVKMAAHRAGEHAEQAEQRDIGDATLEQMRSDVTRLSRDYMTGEPFQLFQEMRRVRERMYAALDRNLWPRDQTDLYLLLGCLNCLMAAVADDLGYPSASEELIRASWAYAVVIDHGPLKAKLRADLAAVAYWHSRPRQALDLAEDGLRYLAGGPNAAQLHLKHGRAAARLGDAATARRAIGAALDARDQQNNDDLLHLSGEFGFSLASQHYLAGSTLLDIPDAERDAVTELERATELYEAGPEEGEDHSFELRMLAHIELAAARLRSGELDGAGLALHPVLGLPPAQRIDPLPQRLEMVGSELARPRYQGSSQATGLVEQIEEFSRDTIVEALSALPG